MWANPTLMSVPGVRRTSRALSIVVVVTSNRIFLFQQDAIHSRGPHIALLRSLEVFEKEAS
jgi:hypothetical protein